MKTNTIRTVLATTFIGVFAVFGMVCAQQYADIAQAKHESSYPIRAFIFESMQLFIGEEKEPLIVEMCTDERETIVVTLTTDLSNDSPQAMENAYQRIKNRAMPAIPVNEKVLSYIEDSMGLDQLCTTGCHKQNASAWCHREFLQGLDACERLGSVLSCAIQYSCSIECTSLTPEITQ